MKNIKYFLLFVMFIFLFSCANKQKVLREEVKKTADELNSMITTTENELIKLDTFIEDLYKNKENYDLSIEKMDVKNGGKYDFFDNTMYYKVKDDGGCFVVATGNTPVTNENKMYIKLLEYAEKKIKNAQENIILSSLVWYISGNTDIAIGYPFFNVISYTPPRFDPEIFFWYQITDDKRNPEKKIIWYTEPFVDVVRKTGWMLFAASPVYNDDKFEGIVTAELSVKKINNKINEYNNIGLILISDKSAIISCNQFCRDSLKLNSIADTDFYSLGIDESGNILTPDECKFSYEMNPDEIIDLYTQIMNQKEFQFELNGEKYFFIIEKIPTVNLILAGFIK